MTEYAKDPEAIFLAALDKATPDERAIYVETACAGNAELLRRAALVREAEHIAMRRARSKISAVESAGKSLACARTMKRTRGSLPSRAATPLSMIRLSRTRSAKMI